MNRRKKILLVTIVSTIVITIVVSYLNREINIKIKYYESREGLVLRLMNKSCEEEYEELLDTSRKYYLVGLISLIICLGSIGLYVSEEERKPP